MRVRIAGISLEVGPETTLSVAERGLLARFSGLASSCRTQAPPISVEVSGLDPRSLHEGRGSATVRTAAGRVEVEHPHFQAEISLAERAVRLRRDGCESYPLAITLRTALASLLPAVGAVPLHAAGVALDGRGVVCLGPSGAGKSTIAAAFDGIVASDETVVVGGDPPTMEATGLLSTDCMCGPVPVTAFLALARGNEFELSPIDPQTAFRCLLKSALVPAELQIRRSTIETLSNLLHHIPTFRLAWRPPYPVWERLRDELDLRPTQLPTWSNA